MRRLDIHLKDDSQPKAYEDYISFYIKGAFSVIKTKDYKYIKIPTTHIYSVRSVEETKNSFDDKSEIELWLKNSSLPVIICKANRTFEEGGYFCILYTHKFDDVSYLNISRFPINDIYQIKERTL